MSRSAMAVVGCLLGFAAQAAARDSTHVLVLAAEMLVDRQLPEASVVAVRIAVSTPGLPDADRTRLQSLRAKLQVKEADPAPDTALFGETQAGALIRLVDALYEQLQVDGATIALQMASRCEPISTRERTQLALRRGLLEMESLDEAGARRSFEEALKLERSARLPAFAPPKTARLLEEVRNGLPPEIVRPASLGLLPPSLARWRPWAWVPAASGAALGVIGGALYLGAKANYDMLANRAPSLLTLEQVHATSEAGQAMQASAFVLIGLGSAALASAAALHFLGDEHFIRMFLQPTPGAPGVAIMAVFP